MKIVITGDSGLIVTKPHWGKFTEIKKPHTSDGDEFLDDAIRSKTQPFDNDRMREK